MDTIRTVTQAAGTRASNVMNRRESSVVTRIAPSPTGALHFGTARTALFNYLFAKKHEGIFIVRIEDTDKKRSKKEFERDILDGLAWLGLPYDALYRQSERTGLYTKYIEKLLDDGHAYISKEPQKDNPQVETEIIRLKNLNKNVTFTDLVRGDITFDTTELGDFVIARSETEPLYHFTVVVDDYEMNVSHVIRGEDHISNTPRQILLQEALGFSQPEYAHIPLILAPDRSKLSKRHGVAAMSEYKKDYLPEAVVNYLALLGFNPGGKEEVFRLPELIKKFDLSRVQKGGAIFDIEKLKSLNHEHIRMLSDGDFEAMVEERVPTKIKRLPEYDASKLGKIAPDLKERIRTLTDIESELLSTGTFYFSRPKVEIQKLTRESDGEITKKHLLTIVDKLTDLPEADFTQDVIREHLWEYANEEGRGAVLWPMRYALTGKDRSPDPFSIAEVLGQAETVNRLRRATAKL